MYKVGEPKEAAVNIHLLTLQRSDYHRHILLFVFHLLFNCDCGGGGSLNKIATGPETTWYTNPNILLLCRCALWRLL